MSLWVTYTFTNEVYNIEKKPGVYVIYGDGKLLYIGQSNNLNKRMLNHKIDYTLSNSIRTPWGYYKNIKIKIKYTIKYGDWAMIEQRLIYKIKPPFNCIGSTKRRRYNNAE